MKVLLIDDDENFISSLVLEFQDRHIEVQAYTQFVDVPKNLIQGFTHAIVDLRLKGENGLNILVGLREQNEEIKMIMLTGFGTISTAVEAMKLGAINYLSKPVSFDLLLHTMQNSPIDSGEAIELSESEMTLAEKEREYIEYVLVKCENNISKAAKILGLHRQSLQRMLKKYPFHRDSF
ncbi:response regulator [Bacteriovorax sp. PP10]|uniref:Response regulator n=1 Tax=Bacteriovorax antarcticus TaxID=3088717 RepID=A0ABU5VQF9_9BACT|nr:response regulator [Bacteriovorax sp. PP10]MEA9355281.1 response regulator [Bacteriovorax sp. PP10]